MLDPESTRPHHINVLRRLDPAVADVLIAVANVVAYNFDAGTNQWSKMRVEGSLFIVKRNAQPMFQLVIMNRLNTENLIEDLLMDFQYEVQVPYLMYRNAADEIIGIWIYDQQECHEVAQVFRRIQYEFSRSSPKGNCASKSAFEELEVASAVPAAEDTLEQSTLATIVPDDSKNELLATFFRAAACVGDTICVAGTAGPNQACVPSPSHQPQNANVSQTSVLHNLLPSQTSVHVRPIDAITSHNSATIQPSSLVQVNPTLLPLMTPTQTTMANAASSSLSVLPPVQPPLASYQPQSVPLHHHPFSLPMATPATPYDMPLLQPFPPPKPPPLLTPAASCAPELTRDQVKGALLMLVQNDKFVDMVYREIAR